MGFLFDFFALIGMIIVLLLLSPVLITILAPLLALGTVAAVICGVIGLVLFVIICIGMVTVFAIKIFVIFLIAALIVTCFLGVSGHSLTLVKGDGLQKEENREISGFSSIDLQGIGTLNIVCQVKDSCRITTDSNLLPLVETFVENGGKLVIRQKKDFRPTKGLLIDVTASSLNKIMVSGAGKVQVSGIDSDSFEVGVNGASSLTGDGKCNTFKLAVSGAAKIDLSKLKAINTTVNAEGAADILVFASDCIKTVVSGVARVRVYGDPKNVDRKIDGLGKFEIVK